MGAKIYAGKYIRGCLHRIASAEMASIARGGWLWLLRWQCHAMVTLLEPRVALLCVKAVLKFARSLSDRR